MSIIQYTSKLSHSQTDSDNLVNIFNVSMKNNISKVWPFAYDMQEKIFLQQIKNSYPRYNNLFLGFSSIVAMY